VVQRWSALCFFILCAVIVTGCEATASTVAQAHQPLPTLIPTSVPPLYERENADRVAFEFLSAWEARNYQLMYDQLSTNTREALSYETFLTAYNNTDEIMSLKAVTNQPNSSVRDTNNPDLVNFNYNTTFETDLFGSFEDPNRELLVVYDHAMQQWKIAWSRGTIFAEIGNGAALHRTTTPVIRGNIYDRDGTILADTENTVAKVRVIKREMPDAAACLSLLQQAIESALPEVIESTLAESADDWLVDVGVLDSRGFNQWGEQLETTCNATFEARRERRYLYGTAMPHILGTVGYLSEAEIPQALELGFPQDMILGRSGIERSQDEILRGQPGTQLSLVNASGQTLRVLGQQPMQVANSVSLTIDLDLQQFVQQELSRIYTNNPDLDEVSKGASAIIMNVRTGEILAMVSYPTYDINAFAPFPTLGFTEAREQVQDIQEDERNPLLNRATQGRYPSGSVMKIATTMAVLDSNIYDRNKRFVCGGIWEREGIVKTDWLAGGHGTVNPSMAVTVSCNPFYYEVGYQMNAVDPFLLPTYLRQFGLGQPTGLTDIEEDSGYIGDPDTLRLKTGNWTFADAAVMAIGQGEVEVTPLQMIRVVAAIANGGDLVRPRLVSKTSLLNETIQTFEPEINGNLNVRPDVIETVREGMCNVTSVDYGTAHFVFRDSPLQAIGVCGKTGTAQDLPRPTTHAWFGAYAPKDDPEIAVLVMVENAGEGSEVAAPIVKTIMEHYFFGTDLNATVSNF
jgi:penicillin-binding protein 2